MQAELDGPTTRWADAHPVRYGRVVVTARVGRSRVAESDGNDIDVQGLHVLV
jgi:hypothetical protein